MERSSFLMVVGGHTIIHLKSFQRIKSSLDNVFTREPSIVGSFPTIDAEIYL